MKRLRNLMRLFSATRNFSLMKYGAWSLRLLFLLLFCSVAMFVALPSEAATPQQTGTDNTWVSISGGSYHTIALKLDGTLWAWGWSWAGQLGDGTNTGSNTPQQIGTDNTWVSIVGGGYHTIALKSDGTLWAWGFNERGQLGDGTNTNRNTPQQIGTDNTWASIAAGWGHTIALKSDGTLWAWGYNEWGQLGDGTNTNRNTPQQIGTDNTWASIAAGFDHTIALKSDGTLWAWGFNAYGQLGNGTNTGSNNTPQQIGTDNTWVSIAAGGGEHTIALKSDGTLWAWGWNWMGQLGDGTNTNRNTPQQIGTDNTWASIAAGFYHTIALKSDGTLWAWGYNGQGQLGNGTNTGSNTPQQIGADNTWVSIAGGVVHTIALKSDGTLWAWGQNAYGQLGDCTNIDRWSPVQITGCDTTPPTTAASPSGGTYNSSKSVTLYCNDGSGSGCATTYYCTGGGCTPTIQYTGTPINIFASTALKFYSKDIAGNSEAVKTATYTIDTTPPEIIATTSPAPNVSGWNNTDVAVTFTCSDSGSGIALCLSFVNVTNEGANQVITGTAVDNAGNSASTSVTLNIDKTTPVITISGAIDGATYALGLVPVASYTVTDALSGVVTSSASLTGGDGLGLGAFTYSVTASDNAGNTITVSVAYSVIATTNGLNSLIQQILASGQIDNTGIANSLISKVLDAANAAARGNGQASDNIMQAFINQVEAQTGNHISPEAAAILINAATYIINN